jgi:hypothetical protein
VIYMVQMAGLNLRLPTVKHVNFEKCCTFMSELNYRLSGQMIIEVTLRLIQSVHTP